MAPEQNPEHVKQVGEDMNDPFTGVVAVFENTSYGDDPNRFWAEHQRKGIYTDNMTLEQAQAKAQEFINDASWL